MTKPAIKNNIKIKPAVIKNIAADPLATAKAVKLIYVTDKEEGYRRIKKGKSFQYLFNMRYIKNKDALKRINSLVIPPAWEEVWICSLPNGHLQATGKDALNRKQYRYHPLWINLRNHTKFYRLLDFAKALPALRKKIKTDLALPGLPQQKVLALVVALMEKTNIRVGNEMYEKLYGSFGLSTLKDKHTKIEKGVIIFSFKGKKGVSHSITLANKKLAKLVKSCRDIPGKELFQYYDDEGKRHTIDSGMVNEYIKNTCGGDFTSKDFRTWAGSLYALSAFSQIENSDSKKEIKQNINYMFDEVAKKLGNTRAVCKKHYVHPSLTDLYETNELQSWLKKINVMKTRKSKGLLPEEIILAEILKKENKNILQFQ